MSVVLGIIIQKYTLSPEKPANIGPVFTTSSYIMNFEDAGRSYENPIWSVWRDTEWIAWGLAKVPRKYNWGPDQTLHPDMSQWTL